jgi:tRNA pseudouridine55 synthase
MPTGINGIFNVNKPAGMTSHDVVATIRRASQAPRVGHAGTLDPLATGVLLICMGQATRITEYLSDHDKKYRARVRLGIETDTYDAAGAVIAEQPVHVTRDQVETALQGFVGKLSQMPPAYSAIKQDGVPLYKLARQGVQVETAPREVEIYSVTLLDFAPPDVEIEVHCSKGTYIRSLAHDLGEKLGCGGHITALTRTALGHFTLEDSVGLEPLREALAKGYAGQFLHPLDEALLDFEAIVVEPDVAKRLQQGNPLTSDRGYSTPLLRAYSRSGQLIGLLEPGETPGLWKPKKIFL